MLKLLILDRDGVINKDSSEFIKTPREWIPLEGSLQAIAKLTQLQFTIVVCTNQSGIGRGLLSHETLEQIHDKMLTAVSNAGGKIDSIFYCPHLAQDNCNCRKPKMQMINAICDRYGLPNVNNIMLVGDSQRDLETIYAAGGVPVLVKTGNGRKTLSAGRMPPHTLVFDNLLEFSTYIENKGHDVCTHTN